MLTRPSPQRSRPMHLERGCGERGTRVLLLPAIRSRVLPEPQRVFARATPTSIALIVCGSFQQVPCAAPGPPNSRRRRAPFPSAASRCAVIDYGSLLRIFAESCVPSVPPGLGQAVPIALGRVRFPPQLSGPAAHQSPAGGLGRNGALCLARCHRQGLPEPF